MRGKKCFLKEENYYDPSVGRMMSGCEVEIVLSMLFGSMESRLDDGEE